jgi:glycine cleavage system aminomethyltransferase T
MAYSPRLQKNIGYAMVPAKSSKLGTGLTVVKKPSVDLNGEIPKS